MVTSDNVVNKLKPVLNNITERINTLEDNINNTLDDFKKEMKNEIKQLLISNTAIKPIEKNITLDFPNVPNVSNVPNVDNKSSRMTTTSEDEFNIASIKWPTNKEITTSKQDDIVGAKPLGTGSLPGPLVTKQLYTSRGRVVTDKTPLIQEHTNNLNGGRKTKKHRRYKKKTNKKGLYKKRATRHRRNTRKK